MIARLLIIGSFVVGLGCPHPSPPVNPPTPAPLVDGGADASACNVPTAIQDSVTGRLVNACATGASVDEIVKSSDLATVRCVAADLLLDLREAPKTEACVRGWMSLHGGAP